MSVQLIAMREHISQPRQPFASGAVVLSQLPRGVSHIGAPTVSLKMVLDGEEQYEIDGRIYSLRPGSFLYVEQGANCEAQLRASAMGVCVALPLGQTINNLMQGESPFGRAMVLPTDRSHLGQLFKRRALQIAGQQEDQLVLAPRAVQELHNALFDQAWDVRSSLDLIKSAKLSTRRSIYSKLELARDMMHAADREALDLATLAREIGLSQFHFSRYFKALYGRSPIQYHRSLRLNRAASFLLSDGYSVLEVALATGYSDQVSLTHAFKKEFGIAPGQFRERGVR